MDSLLKMESKVECTQDSMKLLVHDAASTPASLIFVDRGMFLFFLLFTAVFKSQSTTKIPEEQMVAMRSYEAAFPFQVTCLLSL